MTTQERPLFWDPRKKDLGDQSKFENNALWIREWFHGLFEAANQEDFIRIRQIAKTALNAILLYMPDEIEGANQAYEYGLKCGRLIMEEVDKAYARKNLPG